MIQLCNQCGVEESDFFGCNKPKCPFRSPHDGKPINVADIVLVESEASLKERNVELAISNAQRHINAAKEQLNTTDDTELRYVAQCLVWASETMLAAIKTLL